MFMGIDGCACVGQNLWVFMYLWRQHSSPIQKINHSWIIKMVKSSTIVLKILNGLLNQKIHYILTTYLNINLVEVAIKRGLKIWRLAKFIVASQTPQKMVLTEQVCFRVAKVDIIQLVDAIGATSDYKKFLGCTSISTLKRDAWFLKVLALTFTCTDSLSNLKSIIERR